MEKKDEKEKPIADVSKYQKLNGYISIIFELVIILFSFFTKLPLIIILSFPIFILITIYEQRADICPKQYSRYIFLINVIGFLGYFCFWILSLLIVDILLPIQFIVFLLLTFLSLQVFAGKEYFRRENILIIQHILAVAMFMSIIYSFFDIISAQYINFPADSSVVIIANVFLHIIINLSIFLISFYYLYARHFRNNPWKNFNSALILNVLLIETIAYILINFRNFYILSSEVFINNAILSLLIFPIIFVIFLFVNHLIGIFDKDYALKYCYYSCWIILSILSFMIFYVFYGNFLVWMVDLLFISISIHLLSKFGFFINKIQEDTLKKIRTVNFYFIFIELFLLFFTFYFNSLTDIYGSLFIVPISMFSGYFAFISIFLVTLLLYQTKIISIKQRTLLIDFVLLYTTIIIFYFSLIFTLGTYFVFNIPILCTTLFLYIPLIRIETRREGKRFIKSLVQANSIVLSISLLLFPIIFHLEFLLLQTFFNLLNILNFTLYILFGIIFALNQCSEKLRIRESRTELIVKIQALLEIIIIITTVFFYPFTFFFGTYFAYNIPIMLACIAFYIPLIRLKKRLAESESIKSLIITNTVILSISLLLFPTIVYLEFLLLTSIFNLFNVVNFTLYILFGIISALTLSSKYIKIREKRLDLISKTQIIIGFIIAFTTVFYYLYNYFSIILTNLSIVLPLLFSLLYLYIPARIAYKKGIFNENIMKRLISLNSYIVYIDIFFLSYTFFFTVFEFLGAYNIILSLYLSAVVINFINILFFKLDLISKPFQIICWEIALLFTSYLGFYVTYQFVDGTYYVINVPILFSSLIFYWPILYLKSKIRFSKLIKIMVKITSYVLSVSILLFPTIISLELTKLGFELNYINILNFTLYILYGILAALLVLDRPLNFRERKSLILKSQVLIEFVISVSTVFYYSFIFLSGTIISETLLSIILPLLFTSIFLFLPSFSSYKRGFFNTSVLKKVIIINSLLFWSCIVSIPILIGIAINLNLILIISFSLLFVFFSLLYFDLISTFLDFKDKLVISLKSMKIIVWFLISATFTYGIYTLFLGSISTWLNNLIISGTICLFFLFNLINLPLIENLKQAIFESETSKYDYYKIYKIYEFNKNFIIFGAIFSISFILTSFIQLIDIIAFSYLVNNPLFFFAMYFLIIIILINFFELFIKIDYERFKEYLELSSWLITKSLTLVIFALYPFEIILLNRILLLTLIFSILSPITVRYIKTKVLIFEEVQVSITKGIALLFFVSVLSVYIEILVDFSTTLDYFIGFQAFSNIFIICKVIIFTYFYLSRFNEFFERDLGLRIYRLMLISVIFLGIFSVLGPYIYQIGGIFTFILPILSLIEVIIILGKRSLNYIMRFFSYFIIIILLYLEIGGFFGLISELNTILLLGSISVTLFLSIIANYKRINNIEKFLLYISLSIFSFVIFIPFVPILYNLTISLFIYLSLMGIFYYHKKDKRYKWFIRPCVLLAVFDFISFMSYSVFFNNIVFSEYINILTLSLTLAVTGFLFVFLYNDSPKLFRKRSFYFVLSSNVISLPVFIYFLLIATYDLPIFDLQNLENLVILTASINVGIFLFYLSIAIFQWKLSKAIWSIGYRIWIFLPIVNYLLISKAFTGVDVITNAVNFFGINIYGSNIIAFVICLLISLPFWYTWIKKNFNNVLLITWGLSLILIYWFSQNAFFDNMFLLIMSFIGISLILLIPILIRIKVWNLSSILFVCFSFIMLIFLSAFLDILGLNPLFNASITMIVGGILFIILSFFPSLRAQRNIILAIAYIASISGIFLIVYNLVFAITLQFWISVFISLIILAFSLYTSRILKLNKIFFDRLISSILIISFTGLTYFTFSLIPNLELLSFYLALTVCGASFFVFNYYRMFIPTKKVFPLSMLSLGLSLTASTLWLMFLPFSLFIVPAIFISINLLFLGLILVERRYILWFLSPFPITLIILHPLSLIEIIQPLFIFLIVSLMVYTSVFQILMNLGSKTTKRVLQSKLLNLVCFILNSIYFSIILAYLSPISPIYQIFEGLIVGSILILLSTGYIKKAKLDFSIDNFETLLKRFISIAALMLYFEIGFLSFGLMMDYTDLGMTEIIFSASGIFWFLTFLDLYLFKKVSRKIIFPLNYSTYFLLSIYAFNYFYQYTTLGFEILFLIILGFLIMQYYTIYAIFAHIKHLRKYDVVLLNNRSNQIRSFLSNSIFITIDLYISSLTTSFLLNFNSSFAGISSIFFFLMIFTLLLFILNNIIKYSGKHTVLWILFLVFQGSLTIFALLAITLLNLTSIFSLISLLLINTFMFFYSVFIMSKIFNIKEETIHKFNSILILLTYLEISSLFFGLANLFFGIFESLVISQISLFLITLMELTTVKRIKRKYVLIIHTLSYFTSSSFGFIFLLNIYQLNLTLQSVAIIGYCLTQFYTNISYFNMRHGFKQEKEEKLKKWMLVRKNLLGSAIYITIGNFIWQFLINTGNSPYMTLVILSLFMHFLMVLDKFILKFLGKIAVYFMLVFWVLIFGFGIIYSFELYTIFSHYIIPMIILALILAVAYGYWIKLFDIWKSLERNRTKLRNFLIIVTYLNLITWPLYYITFEILSILTVILLVFGISLVVSLADKSFSALKEETRKILMKLSIFCLGTISSVELYFILDVIVQTQSFSLNISASSLFYLIFIGILIKPFKKHGWLAFLYWTASFFLLSNIVYALSLSGITWSIFAIGMLLYPFFFLLEELKKFFTKFVDNIALLFTKIGKAIGAFIKGIFNFLKKYYKGIRILLCILFGVMTTVLLSNFGLRISLLSGLAVFGLFYGILPSKKTEDYDEIFKQRMTRFIAAWIGMTAFIFIFIIPFLAGESPLLPFSILFGLLLMLGAIILLYLYRLEEKARISILWRFYTLIFFFIILGIEIVIVIILNVF